MSDQPDNSEPDGHETPPADPNEFGKWLVDRATKTDDDSDSGEPTANLQKPSGTQ